MPDPLSPEGYAAAGGTCCPACGSEDISADIDLDNTIVNMVIQIAKCYACDAQWNKVFELTGYDGLEWRNADA